MLKAYFKSIESKKEKKIITKRKITWDNRINNMKGIRKVIFEVERCQRGGERIF